MKVTIKGILKESYLQAHIKYLKGVAQRMKHPFMKDLNSYGVDISDWETVLSYKFGTNVNVKIGGDYIIVFNRDDRKKLYDEYYDDKFNFFSSAYYDKNDKVEYGIDSDGVTIDMTVNPPYYRKDY